MAAIAACSMVGASIGMLVNVTGLFFSPIAEDLQVGRGSVSMSLTIANLVYAVAGTFAPSIVRPFNYKRFLWLSALVVVLTTCGIAATPNLIIFYLLSGLRGVAAGFTGPVLMSILVNNWFYQKAGLINSIAMAVSGLAGAIFSPVLSGIISVSGWRVATLANAALLLIFYLPALLLPVGYFPESSGLKPYGASSETEKSIKETTAPVLPVLVLILTVFAAMGPYLTACGPHLPGLADSHGFSASVGATMLSICMFTNSGGKLVFGVLSEKIGSKRSMFIYGVLTLSGVLMILLIPSMITLYVGAGLLGLVYSLGSVGIVLATRDFVGLANYNRIYPKVYMVAIMSNAVASSAIGFMYDASGTSRMPFLIGALFVLILIAMLLIGYPIRKKQLSSLSLEQQ